MSGVLRIDHCCEVLDFVNTVWFLDVLGIKEFSVSGFWKFSKSKAFGLVFLRIFWLRLRNVSLIFLIAHTGYIYYPALTHQV